MRNIKGKWVITVSTVTAEHNGSNAP